MENDLTMPGMVTLYLLLDEIPHEVFFKTMDKLAAGAKLAGADLTSDDLLNTYERAMNKLDAMITTIRKSYGQRYFWTVIKGGKANDEDQLE